MIDREQQQGSANYSVRVSAVVSIGALLIVLLLHGLGILGLIRGMGGTGEAPPEPPRPPIQTRVLPPPPPPPPPPNPPMRHVSHEVPKEPTPPATRTNPAPPGPEVPDTSAGSVPMNNVQPVYPPEMEDDNVEGRVTLVCDVETTGKTSNCSVQSVSGGQAFARSALDYVHRAQYQPAVRNGQPVKELHKVYVIRFRLDN